MAIFGLAIKTLLKCYSHPKAPDFREVGDIGQVVQPNGLAETQIFGKTLCPPEKAWVEVMGPDEQRC